VRGPNQLLKRFPYLLAIPLLLEMVVSSAGELKPEMLVAWEHYLGAVYARMEIDPAGSKPFLWLDKESGKRQKVRRGEVIVWQSKASNIPAVPHAQIHHWIGAVFVPRATSGEVIAITRDYVKYPKWYGPTITEAHLLCRRGDEDRFTVRYVRKVLFVTAVLETDYDTSYSQVNPTRWYSVARSVRIQQIDEFGKPGERKRPPDYGGGYLWRIYTLTRYEEKDNGVYIEQESIGLSRSIPASLRWVVGPVVKRLSMDLLERSLEQTREAVRARSGK
jgi:hypothetical protein